jgi:preprotein translocase subunit YajC
MLAYRIGLAGLSSLALAAPVLAQEAAGPAGAGGGPSGTTILIQNLLMFVPIILIFYFLLIRPQQKRAKAHREMVANVGRNDTVVTSGGLIGKVTKVADDELTIELADNVRVRTVRSMIIDVRGKGEPVAANDAKAD